MNQQSTQNRGTMILFQYKKLLKSKYNLFLLILCSVPVIVSYCKTYLDYQEWRSFLVTKPTDLNLDAAIAKVNGTSGFTYLFNFLFSPDYSTMLLLVFLLGFGVMTSGILYKNRLNGFGTLVLQRTSYITYLKKMIAAQALYIISFMLLFYGILIFISITLFGFGLRGQHITGSLTFSDYSIMKIFSSYSFSFSYK